MRATHREKGVTENQRKIQKTQDGETPKIQEKKDGEETKIRGTCTTQVDPEDPEAREIQENPEDPEA